MGGAVDLAEALPKYTSVSAVSTTLAMLSGAMALLLLAAALLAAI